MAAAEFTDDEFIEFNRTKNKLLKTIREASFTIYKRHQPNVSNKNIYEAIDRDITQGKGYGKVPYKNSDEYKTLWDNLIDLGETAIADADSKLRRSNKDRWNRIQIAASRPEVGGGRTKRSRRSCKQRKTKRRARR